MKLAVAFLVAGAIGVATLQPRLARVAHAAGDREDVYAFPPPAQLHAATLGWEAAAVDLLWASLLVQYGTHWSDHRDFVDGPRYADAIIELEPTYAPLYKYIDTIVAFRPLRGTEADAREARRILEVGTRALPDDPDAWLQYGQFIAFLGPSFLQDPAEQTAWRTDGARAMGHAFELGADPTQAVSAAGILSRAGQQEAALHYLEHAYAFTDHPSMVEIHEEIGRRLREIYSERDHLPAPLGTGQ